MPRADLGVGSARWRASSNRRATSTPRQAPKTARSRPLIGSNPKSEGQLPFRADDRALLAPVALADY